MQTRRLRPSQPAAAEAISLGCAKLLLQNEGPRGSEKSLIGKLSDLLSSCYEIEQEEFANLFLISVPSGGTENAIWGSV